MGRHNRRKDEQPRGRDPESAVAPQTIESHPDGDWVVRQLRGSSSTKEYRCPGCDQIIRMATPHLVAWPVDDADADHRRHWHSACWRGRFNRKPRHGI